MLSLLSPPLLLPLLLLPPPLLPLLLPPPPPPLPLPQRYPTAPQRATRARKGRANARCMGMSLSTEHVL